MRDQGTHWSGKIAAVWETLLGLDAVGIRESFFDLGGHSLLAVRLIFCLEKQFGHKLSLADVFRSPTIEQMATVLRRQNTPARPSSLAALQPRGTRPPFFWIHGDCTNATLPGYLGEDQPVYGLLHQSQDGKRAQYTEVDTIAAYYLDEVRKVQPHGPYFLGGYSFGALVAYELAQQLRKRGQEAALLVLLDPTDTADVDEAPLEMMPGGDQPQMERGFRRRWNTLRSLVFRDKLRYICLGVATRFVARKDRLRKHLAWASIRFHLALRWPLPPELQSPYLLDLYRQATRRYHPEPYPGSALLIEGEARHSRFRTRWHKLVPQNLEVFHIPAAHMDLVKEPAFGAVANLLGAHLKQAQTRVTTKSG